MPGLAPDATVTLVQDLDDILDLREWLGGRREWLGCDIETSGLNLGRDRIRLVQFGDQSRGWAISWGDWAGAIKDLLPRYRGKIAFHNSAFDLGFLKRDGVQVPQRWVHDTMIMAHLLEPRFAIGLKPQAAKHVGPEAWMGKDALAAAMRGGNWTWGTIPVDHPSYYIYSAMDTMLTAALAEKLWPRIQQYMPVYEVEMGCIHVLRDARLRGVRIDLDYAHATRAVLIAENQGLQQLIPFDPGKDRQTHAWLERAGHERGWGTRLENWWPWRTEKDNISFDDDALGWAEDKFPTVVPPLRKWRKNEKLVNSYFDNLIEMNVDGILRCNIKHVGARTARTSITEPALQTLPRGRVVRDAFIATEGSKLVLADYSQMEARVFASFAGCTPMIESFKDPNNDQHTWVAGLAYHNGDESLVQEEERQVAKNYGYANIYGAGIPKMAATAGIPIAVVEQFKARYDAMFPEIEAYKQKLIGDIMNQIRETGEGYVTTILGRRLPVDKDKPYKGLNYIVQGSATGDIIKLKLIELAEAGMSEWIRLPIHDEVYSEVPNECVDDSLRILNEVMPETRLFECPLSIETDVCERWGEHYERDPARRYHYVGA